MAGWRALPALRLRARDTVDMMGAVVARMIGWRLTYRRLIGKVAA